MIYGVLRILHIAHAGIYTAGAYLGLLAFRETGNLVIALIVAMTAAALLGDLIERFMYRSMLARPRIVALIASIGLFICLSDLFRILAGPHQLAFDVPELAGRYTAGGITVSGIGLVIVGGTAAIFVALWFVIRKTSMGLGIRAGAQDVETAKTMGIDVDRSVSRVFMIGSAIAAFGGVAVAILYNAVYTTMGDMIGYKGLALIVIGGFGSISGAVLAAFLLGFAETALTTYMDLPLAPEGTAQLMLVPLNLIRPQGLLGKASPMLDAYTITILSLMG